MCPPPASLLFSRLSRLAATEPALSTLKSRDDGITPRVLGTLGFVGLTLDGQSNAREVAPLGETALDALDHSTNFYGSRNLSHYKTIQR